MVVIALLVFSLFSIVAVPAHAQEDVMVISTDEEDNTRDEFFETLDIYFRIHDGPETDYRVRLIEEEDDEIVHQVYVRTDEDGNFISADHQVYLEHDGAGEYYIRVDEVEGEGEGTYEILVYDEQDFTVESTVHTYDSSEREQADRTTTFADTDDIYFTVRVRDQHGHPPELDWIPVEFITVQVEKEGEVILEDEYLMGDDGNVEDDFGGWDLVGPGDYEIVVVGRDEEEYVRHTFTIMEMDIDIDDEYTQGQVMVIRIESDYDDYIDIIVEDDEQEPMDEENASWEYQVLENRLWVNETVICEDASDGTYYVRVRSSDDDELLGEESFELKKYSLDASTDKDAYLPQDTVKLHYMVERLIDGSRAEDMRVECRLQYFDEEWEHEVENHYPTYDGYFEFEVPSDIQLDSYLEIDLWVNSTDQEHSTHWGRNDVFISDLDATFWTDSDEYLPGQKVYVTAETFVQWTNVPVEDASVTVDLMREGESVGEGQHETSLETDDNGEVVIPIHLPGEIDPGYYHVNVTAERYDMIAYPPEEEIEIKEEIKRLDVLLDRDEHSYSPGETVEVEYTVTKQGEVVDSNVRYEVIKGTPQNIQKVYEKGYADGDVIEFTVPENFNQDQDLYVLVDAKVDQETTGEADMGIPVTELEVLLNADKSEYSGGETINFEYEVIGREAEYTEMYKIIDVHGDIIEMDEPEDGEFYFEVPEAPSSEYEVLLEVSSEGLMVEESIELHRADRYQLEIGIETSSSYTTGVYEPGDEIEISYRVRAVGQENIPDKITLNYYIFATGETGEIQTSSPTGTFTLDVPDVTDGTYHLQVTAEFGEGPVLGVQNIEPIEVEEDPSIWSYRIFGSLSLRGLIGIILLLVLLAVGFNKVSQKEKPRSVLSDLFRKREKESEEDETKIEEEEERSPAEEAHGWEGPEEVGYEDEDQIEPGRPE